MGKEFSKYTIFDPPINEILTVTIEDNSDVRMSYIRKTQNNTLENETEFEILMSFFRNSKDLS